MPLWVEACPDATVPAPSCVDPLVWVDVSASQPFTLTEAHLATMGEAFAAGLFLVWFFWFLGHVGGVVLKAINKA